MSDIDEEIRSGLHVATDGGGEISAVDLAERLEVRRGAGLPEPSGRRHRRRFVPAIAAAVVLLLSGAALAVWHTGRDEPAVVDATRGDGEGADMSAAGAAEGIFGGWTPGWHEIRLGTLRWTETLDVLAFRGHLVAYTSGLKGAPSSPGGDGPVIEAFDPDDRSWKTIPNPPFAGFTLAAAGDHLVAVSGADEILFNRDESPFRWATWQWGDEAWVDRGVVPVAPVVSEALLSWRIARGRWVLVWTGQRLLDLTSGAALDPVTGAREVMTMPDHLNDMSGSPVWVGDRVVLTSWYAERLLTWDAWGRYLGDVPGPSTVVGGGYVGPDGVSVDGSVVMVGQDWTANEGDPEAVPSERRVVVGLDPVTSAWSQIDGFAEPSAKYGSDIVRSTGSELMVGGCADGEDPPELFAPSVVRNGSRQGIGNVPTSSCDAWVGLDGALVTWPGSRTYMEGGAANAPRLWVWVEPRPG